MTRYSRAVIPGRPSDASSLNSEIEDLVADRGRAGGPANDEDEISEDEKIAFVERAASDRRAKDSRRKGSRRRVSDFAPLPGEAAHRAADGGSKKGPLLLAGALVVVGVFGVVVWNAYREGVRPEDSAAAPVIAEEGAFKSKPAADARTAPTPAEATVFEQVESRPSPAPAPEVRPEIPPPVAAKAAEPAVVQPAAAAKPAEAKPAPAPTKPATTVAAAKPPAGVVGTTKAAALPVVGGSAKTTAPTQAVTPAPAKAVAPPATPPAAAPADAPLQLAVAAPAAPAFSSGGKFAVQIAAPATESGAQAEWAKAAKKAPELFGSAERIIVQAEVNGKSVYRVRAGAFATAADADGFCNAFKAKGGACYRVAK